MAKTTKAATVESTWLKYVPSREELSQILKRILELEQISPEGTLAGNHNYYQECAYNICLGLSLVGGVSNNGSKINGILSPR